MRAFNALTSSGISAVICGAVVTALSPLLLLGEGQGDGVLYPVRVPLPREPRELYVLFGQIFEGALTDELGHLLPERRPPHHPVPPGRQDVEAFHRLVDDREVVRRVIDGRSPRSRDRQAPERRVRGLPVGAQPLVVVPVEVDLVAFRLVGLVDGVAHAEQDTLLLGPPVVTLAHVEHERERMLGPLGHVREADDLVPHGHHGNLHPDHPSNIPRPPRPAGVHDPLRLEGTAGTLDNEAVGLLADAGHLAHLEEIHRVITEHRIRGVAGSHRRVDVSVVRGVGRPHKAVPVQIGEPPPTLLRLDPLVLDPGIPPHLDQSQVTFLLLLCLGGDVVSRLPKAGVEAYLGPEPQVQLPGELAQLRRRRRATLLADNAGRTARRPTSGPTALQHGYPPDTATRQPVRRPQPQVSTANHTDVVDRHARLLLNILVHPLLRRFHPRSSPNAALLLNHDSTVSRRSGPVTTGGRTPHLPLPISAGLARQDAPRRTGDHDPTRMYS